MSGKSAETAAATVRLGFSHMPYQELLQISIVNLQTAKHHQLVIHCVNEFLSVNNKLNQITCQPLKLFGTYRTAKVCTAAYNETPEQISVLQLEGCLTCAYVKDPHGSAAVLYVDPHADLLRCLIVRHEGRYWALADCILCQYTCFTPAPPCPAGVRLTLQGTYGTSCSRLVQCTHAT